MIRRKHLRQQRIELNRELVAGALWLDKTDEQLVEACIERSAEEQARMDGIQAILNTSGTVVLNRPIVMRSYSSLHG